MAPYLCLEGHGPPDFPGKETDRMLHTYTAKKVWFASLKLWGKKVTIITSFQFIECNRNHNPVSFDGNSHLPGTSSEEQKCVIFCARLKGKQ